MGLPTCRRRRVGSGAEGALARHAEGGAALPLGPGTAGKLPGATVQFGLFKLGQDLVDLYGVSGLHAHAFHFASIDSLAA